MRWRWHGGLPARAVLVALAVIPGPLSPVAPMFTAGWGPAMRPAQRNEHGKTARPSSRVASCPSSITGWVALLSTGDVGLGDTGVGAQGGDFIQPFPGQV
jgi:hypothetical protein